MVTCIPPVNVNLMTDWVILQ